MSANVRVECSKNKQKEKKQFSSDKQVDIHSHSYHMRVYSQVSELDLLQKSISKAS